MPVDYSAIQVDGGSEFRGVFENACRDRNMPLFVLPDTLETLDEDVLTYLDVYNIDRPHWSLNYYSPMNGPVNMVC